MTVGEVDINVFDDIFSDRASVYDSARFNLLNAAKVSQIKALALFDTSGNPVCGQIFGLKDDGCWQAPFSAPFSALSAAPGIDLTSVSADDFYSRVSDYLQAPVRVICPPPVYATRMPVSSQSDWLDANYHYPMSHFADYEGHLSRSGRYNHHRWRKHVFECFHTDDIERAYSIIARNRAAMGYPLAMSLEQVMETVKIVPAHFFVQTCENQDSAAAMIYEASPTVAQVIYWGDLPEFRPMRAMNALAYNVFSWFAENRPDIQSVDIGPASSMGVRNEGLCAFKESIGCVYTPKAVYTFKPR